MGVRYLRLPSVGYSVIGNNLVKDDVAEDETFMLGESSSESGYESDVNEYGDTESELEMETLLREDSETEPETEPEEEEDTHRLDALLLAAIMGVVMVAITFTLGKAFLKEKW